MRAPVAFVGPDLVSYATQTMDKLIAGIGGSGEIAEVTGPTVISFVQLQIKGWDASLAKNPNVKVVAKAVDDDLSQEKAETVATTLLSIGIALAGILAFGKLPVSPLPQVEYPTINVGAGLPGAGVGCAIDREVLAILAERSGGEAFSSGSLTEDYELGLEVAADGGGQFADAQRAPGFSVRAQLLQRTQCWRRMRRGGRGSRCGWKRRRRCGHR